MNEVKAGVNTTEFWGSYANSLVAIIPLVTSSSVALQMTCVASMTLAWVAYIVSRGMRKS